MDYEECPECGEMFPEDELQEHFLKDHCPHCDKPEQEED